MTIKNNEISATEFKKHFLRLVDQVKNNHNSLIITKRKLPIAKVVPLETTKLCDQKSYFGSISGIAKINGDIVNCSFEEDWEVNHE